MGAKRLFPPLPPGTDTTTGAFSSWRREQIEQGLQDHEDRITALEAKPKAPLDRVAGLMEGVPTPLIIAVVAWLISQKPELALKLFGL